MDTPINDVGKRHMVNVEGLGNFYVYISEYSVDITIPGENDPKNKVVRDVLYPFCEELTRVMTANKLMENK